MNIRLAATIFILLPIIVSCNQHKNNSHTETLILLNRDFNRYEGLFTGEVVELYKQIEKNDYKDSIRNELILKASEIQKHANKLIQDLDSAITDNCNNYSLQYPLINNYSKRDLDNIQLDNFYLKNKYNFSSASNIKEALTSFHLHLVYINQKNIQSIQLEKYLTTSIQTYNYLPDEPWETTLIVDKTTLDLITALQRIKFEIRMSEYMTIKYLKIKLDGSDFM